MIFQNRMSAAEQLAQKLLDYHLEKPLVLGIPRGAVPMAALIAERLHGDLDVVLVHKFSPPWQPELAIGSVTEDGRVLLGRIGERIGLPAKEVEHAAQDQIRRLQEKRQLYTPYRSLLEVAGRAVVIVDDGIATGATMLAAIEFLRAKGAARLIVAAPVASNEAATALSDEEGVETCFLDTPADFFAVSQFYDSFPQVEDEDVIAALAHMKRSRVPSELGYV